MENKKIKQISILIIGIIILLVAISMFAYKELTLKTSDNEFGDSYIGAVTLKDLDNKFGDPYNENFYDEDKCRCLERKRLKCNNDFELNEEKRQCERENEYTNVVLGCSKYECSGQVYSFNFNTKEWENKNI